MPTEAERVTDALKGDDELLIKAWLIAIGRDKMPTGNTDSSPESKLDRILGLQHASGIANVRWHKILKLLDIKPDKEAEAERAERQEARETETLRIARHSQFLSWLAIALSVLVPLSLFGLEKCFSGK